MFTAKEIWEAGRASLGLTPPAAATPATSPATAAPLAAPATATADVFDPADFTFESRPYRIHFKNGNSGEYEGDALTTAFPFDPAQIESVEPV